MDLVARVEQALSDRSVHPTEFERCACALLQPLYPGLSAVEGGHDFGRDAEIYFPLGDGDTRSRGQLLVTTGDPAANLRTGLRRMREERVTVDLVVIVCLRPVSARARATLDDICAEYGLESPHVYGRDWLVAKLVREPVWRQRLLDVAGELGALLDQPLEMLERATPKPALIGREVELSMLEELVEVGADAVVMGVSGVGKTRLAAELNQRVFLELAESGRVVDELLLKRPAAVVVDDAHTRLDELRVLRRARQQEGLRFSIIATTWPDRSDGVVDALPRAQKVPVDLLELSHMNLLVESVGVTGHRARAAVLRQAEGRPGWALALCQLLVKGNGHDVVSGAAHLANVERFLRRATESETALDSLACVAALGHAPTETLDALAPLLGVPPANLVKLMDRLAQHGLVEWTNGGWRSQPALGAPLVAKWFFTNPPGRPWSTLEKTFPDRSLDLAAAAIAAARMGSTAARRSADSWARSLPDPPGCDTATLAVLSEYSTLGEDPARFAVKHARTVLAGPREAQQFAGISYDPTGDAAARLLAQAARQWLVPEAVSGLLDLAVNDSRPRPQTPEHPLRVLKDLASRLDPDFGAKVEIRERLVSCTLDWLAAGTDASRWTTATELITAIFTVEVSGSWMDPGAPNTVTWSQGVDCAAHLERLIVLWAQVEQTLDADRRADPSGCPAAALALLVNLAGEWMRLAAGFAPGYTDLSDGQKQAGLRGGKKMLASMRPALQAVPGLALRAQRLLDDLTWRGWALNDLPASFDVDPDLQDLVGGHRHRAGDIEGMQQNRSTAMEALAGRLAELGPRLGSIRFEELLRQAQLGGTHADAGGLAERMRQHMTHPVTWYQAARETVSPWLLHAALTQCLVDAPAELPDSALALALDNPSLRTAVISAVLDRTDIDHAAALVIADLRVEDASLLDRLFVRDTADEVLYRLLVHQVPAIVAAAAISFAVGQEHGPVLPEPWRVKWREAICRLRAEDLDSHSIWRASELLQHVAEHDPNLFEQWFTRRLDDMNARGFLSAPEPHGCEKYLARLPQPHRERLARRCARQPRIGQSLLTYLIGPDRELAERLLDDKTVTVGELLETIEDQRNTVLEKIGPLLLERGVAPERIAKAASVTYSWEGPEPSVHQRTLEYFNGLAERVPALLSVAAAGRAEQAALREEAEVHDRQDRVRGR